MTTLRSKIDIVPGIRYMISHLDIKSALANHALLSQPFITSRIKLEQELNNIEILFDLYKKSESTPLLLHIESKLEQIHDIYGTVKRISKGEILDDIELFEIKRFAILNQEIAKSVSALALTFIEIPNLQKVIDILDPDRQNIPHFYIYSSYNPTLLELRNQHKKLQLENPEEAETIRQKAIALEDEIRSQLSIQLKEYDTALKISLDILASLDVLMAKAKQAITLNLIKPIISESTTYYKGLFNPQIKELLEVQNKTFQPIDIELFPAPCLITGVNMGGKTVLLKTIGLTQYLFQFGFFVPATSASITLVDNILISMGDDQSELNGLSSFASEMSKINDIIQKSRSKIQLLALIDELARTTNPEEGKAIVNATLDILSINNACCLVTTHYSGLNWNGRRLAVKGLITEKLTNQLTIKNINDFMDYTLIESNSETATNQAIQIAKLLGVDDELLTKATDYLSK